MHICVHIFYTIIKHQTVNYHLLIVGEKLGVFLFCASYLHSSIVLTNFSNFFFSCLFPQENNYKGFFTPTELMLTGVHRTYFALDVWISGRYGRHLNRIMLS